MTYFFETYGCEMNIAESAAVEQLFISRGWTKASEPELADMVRQDFLRLKPMYHLLRSVADEAMAQLDG